MKQKIYHKKRRWKWILASAAFAIFLLTAWFTNRVAHSVSSQERNNARVWAEAIHKKASSVNFMESYFEEIRQEEQRRVELLASTYKNLLSEESSENLSFYLEIVSKNKTIPIVLTDSKGRILETNNVDFNPDTVEYLRGSLRNEFTVYSPIVVRYYEGKYNNLYYKDSRLSSELRDVLNDLTYSFFDDVAENSASVPVIITDSLRTKIFATGNLSNNVVLDTAKIFHSLETMAEENPPIVISLTGQGRRFIYYYPSNLVTELRIYPFVQFGILALLLLLGYLLFSLARNTEQNQVWAGMSKETAHQLGTPISSLMAWVELMKLTPGQEDVALELDKDVKRLHSISDRFSKIGSVPSLEPVDLVETLNETVTYFQSRTSKKVKFATIFPEHPVIVPLNRELFAWVVENLCKNAVDAMEGIGDLKIEIIEEQKSVIIDFSDTGKGVARAKFKTVFTPGFTSKKRGWGLGLSLVKRIVKNYHFGKVFVKSSVIGQGTTFRVVLKKSI